MDQAKNEIKQEKIINNSNKATYHQSGGKSSKRKEEETYKERGLKTTRKQTTKPKKTNLKKGNRSFEILQENMDVIQNSLSIFVPPPVDKSITKEYWVEFNPIATITDSSVIEFNIPGASVDYIILSKTRLHVKYRITDENSEPTTDERDLNGNPTSDSDQVGPVNLTLHSIFRQIELSLNQKIVSPNIGVNYPYKAMTDMLLRYVINRYDLISRSGCIFLQRST